MKTILIATDFSPVSDNIVNYAIQFTENLDVKIVLLHVGFLPTIPSEVPQVLPIDEIIAAGKSRLETIKQHMHASFQRPKEITCEARVGFVSDEIMSCIAQFQIDLVIVGIQSVDLLSERLFGSNSTALIEKSPVPVLVVPENATFNGVRRIGLACENLDFKDDVLVKLDFFLESFSAELHVVNVAETSGQNLSATLVESLFKTVNHVYHPLQNTDVITEIQLFLEDNAIDMIVTIPQHHGFFHRLFNESKTKKLAFHVNKPLLAIHA